MKYKKLVMLIGINLLMFTHFAQATDAKKIEVLDEKVTTHDDPYSASVKFIVNDADKTKARVWVEADIDGGEINTEGDREKSSIKKFLPGLSYDPSTKTVIYKGEGSDAVICGTYSPGNFWNWSSSVKPSGHCKFITKFEKRANDDGYYVKQNPHLIVQMEIN